MPRRRLLTILLYAAIVFLPLAAATACATLQPCLGALGTAIATFGRCATTPAPVNPPATM